MHKEPVDTFTPWILLLAFLTLSFLQSYAFLNDYRAYNTEIHCKDLQRQLIEAQKVLESAKIVILDLKTEREYTDSRQIPDVKVKKRKMKLFVVPELRANDKLPIRVDTSNPNKEKDK